MSKEVICKNCGAVMFEYMEDLLLCPNCDNEAYPDVEDPDYPGEMMQLMPEEDYDLIYDNSELIDHGLDDDYFYADDYD